LKTKWCVKSSQFLCPFLLRGCLKSPSTKEIDENFRSTTLLVDGDRGLLRLFPAHVGVADIVRAPHSCAKPSTSIKLIGLTCPVAAFVYALLVMMR